jgi:hypothetical protein
MVSFNVIAALAAGLIGTIAMTFMMQASTAMGMTRMPSMPLIQGRWSRATCRSPC